MKSTMTEDEMAETVKGLLETVGAEWGSEQIQDLVDLSGIDRENAEAIYHARLTSFKEGMVMTSNAGFTVRLQDGSEFQITVVKSRA
jgi:hypothetical protein